MWNRNFLFREGDGLPLEHTENELFHETTPAVDSSGLTMEKYISVWIQGEGEEETPMTFTTLYVRTATLDPVRKVGFLQPLQGRTHQIKRMLTGEQKTYLRDWLSKTYPSAWAETSEQFQDMLSEP